MSEEEARKIVDTIKQEEFPYALAIAKAYEKLQQENEHNKYILNEFEKWLKYCIDSANKTLEDKELDEDTKGYALARKHMLDECLNELKNLKEGKK